MEKKLYIDEHGGLSFMVLNDSKPVYLIQDLEFYEPEFIQTLFVSKLQPDDWFYLMDENHLHDYETKELSDLVSEIQEKDTLVWCNGIWSECYED